jgi:hypothetical protein
LQYRKLLNVIFSERPRKGHSFGGCHEILLCDGYGDGASRAGFDARLAGDTYVAAFATTNSGTNGSLRIDNSGA